MIGQEAREHPEDCVTDGHQSALSCAVARRRRLASFAIGCAMRIMRDEPQGIRIEPIAQGGTAAVRYLGQCADAGAAFEATNSAASQLDPLCAILLRADIANRGQGGGSGRWTDSGQLHEEREVWPLRQQCEGSIEPQLWWGQGVGEGCALKGVGSIRLFEAHA
jgi:hypothetical protein